MNMIAPGSSFRYEDVLGNPRSPHRASARQQIYTSLENTGQDFKLLGNAPLIGITAPTGTMVSCNMMAARLAEAVVGVLKERKMMGLIAPIAGVSDGVLNGHDNMGYSLHSRNIMANSVAYASDQYKPDGHIGLFACDKTGPAEVMGYSVLKYNDNSERGTVPSVMMYAGSTIPGFCHLSQARQKALGDKLRAGGVDELTHDIVTGFKVPAVEQGGFLTREEGEEIIRHTVEEIGACQGMYTANTMSVGLEVLGMTAPESSIQITTGPINDMVLRTVECMEICIREGITPNQIINEASMRNAMAVINALGGSTNAVLHFKALANRRGLHLDNEFFREVRSNTPMVGDLKPFGAGDMVDYIQNGDHKTLLRRMIDGGYIDGSLMTVTGKSLGDNVESMSDKAPTGKTTLRSFEKPVREMGNLVPLSGNLAEHAIMKVTSDNEKSFTGPAICFDSEVEAVQGIMNGEVEDGMVVVIRFVGPKAAAIPEMLTPTSLIQAKGLKVALISDGRFSGGSYGSVVGHITPEAADGGPIAKLITGDEIQIDSDTGIINVNGVNLDEREAVSFEDKRDAFHPTKQFSAAIGTAEEGADYIAA